MYVCMESYVEIYQILHVCFLQDLKNQSRITLSIVRCPPVTTVLIRRPALRYQLGFCVQNGIVGNTKPDMIFAIFKLLDQ